MFLPIFFFTLVAGWRFGARAAVAHRGAVSPGQPRPHRHAPGPGAPGDHPAIRPAGRLAALAAARASRPTLALLALVVATQQALTLLPP